MTLIVPTFTLTIACQHMLKHTKAFNLAFQAVIRCYVHKTRSFRNLILPQNNPFFVQLSAISSAKLIIMIKTNYSSSNTVGVSVQKWRDIQY